MKMRKILLTIFAALSIVSCTSSNQNSTNDNTNNNNSNNNTNNNGSNDQIDDDNTVYEYKYYGDEDSFTAGAVKLSFNSAGNYNYLKGIDGKKVALKGFMFTSSPVDGSFIF